MTQQYNFFLGCLNVAKKKHQDLINDLHSCRRPTLRDEVVGILKQIDIALSYGELTAEEAKFLKDEFNKLDFMNISIARAAVRQSQKYMGG